MKLLVFAHVPPPHHGQSYMVKLMVDGFGGDRRKQPDATPSNPYGIEVYHVNARLSRDLEDIGEARTLKVFTLLRYCVQAIWCRLRYDVRTLYYVPSPGKRSALLRDWIVMAVCRPFFPRVVLHWHAAGLGKWLETVVGDTTRSTAYHFFKHLDLCIVLSEFNRSDAEKFWPRRVQIVHNGIPDPCPDFASRVQPQRAARVRQRQSALAAATAAGQAPGSVTTNVLYLAHCTRDKGVFDAIAGVRQANARLASEGSPLKLHLNIAGGFVNHAEREEFNALLNDPDVARQATYLGLVSGETKNQALLAADIFLFPTFFANENQPVNLIEAMAWGLPVVTTRWRSVAESLPSDYPGLAEPNHPEDLAAALFAVLGGDHTAALRNHFVGHFTLEPHLRKLSAAIRSVESEDGTEVVAGNAA